MGESNTRRIILLGKTGAGKSSLANTIFGEAKFQINRFNDSEEPRCQAETVSVNGRSITLIDTPGFFDTGRSEEDLKPEIVRCITECAPGPHAFLIVLRVEKFTEHEQAVIEKICQYFSEDALKYAVIVFTHGDQLCEGMKIKDYVDQSKGLSDLVGKCGGRCHVVDNKYWKQKQQDEYRSNQVQVAELLNTIDEMVKENNGGYTDERLQEVERAVQIEEERIRNSSANKSQEEIRKQAKSNIFKKLVDKEPRTRVRGLVGVVVITGLLAAVLAVLINSKSVRVLREAPLDKEVIATSAAAVARQQIAETVGTIAEAHEEFTPLRVVQETLEAVVKKLKDLYARTCNRLNPFEPTQRG